MTGATARIILRYVAGIIFGSAVGIKLAADPDVVMVLSALIGVAIEFAYAMAKRKGWSL